MNNNISNRNKSTSIRGGVIIAIGLILTFSFFKPATDYTPGIFNMLVFFGPCLLISGLVIFIRGYFFNKSAFSKQTVRWCGLIMLLLGGFPWLYTPLIISDRGMEGSGMLGTILFIVLGIPGILAIIASIFIKQSE
jgi:uncharacterized membrane protein